MLRRAFFFFAILFVILVAGFLAMRRGDIPYDTLEGLYANDQSRFTTLDDGLKVHYRDEGLRAGNTLVLVHGFSASLHTWEPWVARLKDDYRVITLDLPGHGLTRTPDHAKMNVPYFGEAVDQITTELGVDRFVLVGNSMGGATSWQFALEHPQRLEGLVLIASSGWQEQRIVGEQPLIFRLLSNPVARTLLKEFDLKALIKDGLENSFVDQSFVTEDMVSRYAYMSRGPGHRAGILAMMTGPERLAASNEVLAPIEVPTLILQGDADQVVAPSGAPKFNGAIAGSELIMYEQVGHVPQEEVADRSVADLRDFLARRVWPETPASEDANLASTPQ